MRLIDADALGNRLYHEVFEKDSEDQRWDSGCWMRYRLFEKVLREQPTVEQPEQQWIPCSERLPDTDRNVFIARGTPESMTVCVGHYRHDYDQWYEDRNWFAKCLYDGLYWCEMPSLPEPYKRGEEHE